MNQATGLGILGESSTVAGQCRVFTGLRWLSRPTTIAVVKKKLAGGYLPQRAAKREMPSTMSSSPKANENRA